MRQKLMHQGQRPRVWYLALVGMLLAGAVLTCSVVWAEDAEPSAPEDPMGSSEDEGETSGEAASDDSSFTEEAHDPHAGSAAAEGTGPVSVLSEFFAGLETNTLESRVLQAYAEAAVQDQPLGRFEGRPAILEQYRKVLEGSESIAFEVRDEFVSGEETIVLWSLVLHYTGKDPVSIDGASHLKMAAGKIAVQRDYYDLGAAVYERIPVLGAVVRWIKGRLSIAP